MSNSNATNVEKNARLILRYTPLSIDDIARDGYKGALPPGLNAEGEAEMRAAVQAEAKKVVAWIDGQ